MEMSVREARAQFAAALAAAQRGDRVVITKNGRPVAELGPPTAAQNWDWDSIKQRSRELGWDKVSAEELWPADFDDPAFSLEALGFDKDGHSPDDPVG